MHGVLEEGFPSLIVESRPTAKRGISKMFVLRLSDEQKKDREMKLQLEKEQELSRKLGFRRVFKALADAKKPMIGHAVMYDLLFALSHFECALPESYPEFKQLAHSLFPVIFDTQFLAKSEPFMFLPKTADSNHGSEREHRFGSMALGAVYKVFKDEASAAKSAGKPTVEVSFAPGHDRYAPDCEAFHEAGYDAYITGYAFAHMAKQALSPEFLPKLNARSTMWKALYHFNLSGDDDLVNAGVHVHVRGLRGKNDQFLKGAFADVKAPGGESSGALKDTDLCTRWIDDDSAFVILPEACKDALAPMLEKNGAEDHVGGLQFTSLEDWLSSKRKAVSAAAADAKEPAQKRARISA